MQKSINEKKNGSKIELTKEQERKTLLQMKGDETGTDKATIKEGNNKAFEKIVVFENEPC